MLNSHPSLAIPGESHFIYQLAQLCARAKWPGKLEGDGDWRRLVNYLLSHPHLQRWQLKQELLRSRLEGLPRRSHSAAFRAVFEAYSRQQGKALWGDKTPQHVQYMLVLDRLFPGSRFIHVVRDGRDVALSLLSRAWGPRHISLAGHYWSWLVLSGMVSGAVLGRRRYREVRYEDLVASPQTALEGLCQWMGLPYSPAMLLYHQTAAAREYARGGPAAERLARPIEVSRLQRWKAGLSTRQVRTLIGQAGGLLAYMGYPVGPLPRRQQARLEELGRLFQAESVAALSSQAGRQGRVSHLRWGLLSDRLGQLLALPRGRLAAWARGSLRWQRTVASMLE